jgi:hypothetical protein
MTEVPFRPRDDRPVYCSDCYGDLRRKQEAQEAAEASAAAARIATSGGKAEDEPLEDDGPSEPVDAEAAAALAATAIPADEVTASADATGDAEPVEATAPAAE